jgi:uncharacterized protein YjbJ (UPF0337 family)
MDEDRIEGKAKQAEGEVQEGWGETKDKARDLWEDAKDKVDGDDEDELVETDEETA